MRQYYSPAGSDSLPESARQTDCLFSAGPHSRARCRLWSSVASRSGSQKSNPEKFLFFPSFASRLPFANGCHQPLIPELQEGDTTCPGAGMPISRASGLQLSQGMGISQP